MELGELQSSDARGLVLLFVAGLILAEAAWLVYMRRTPYAWKEACTSLGVAIGRRLINVLTAGIALTALMVVYEHRVAAIKLDGPVAVMALFLLFEFAYYWNHRLSHEVRWLWATHSVHHTPNHMNLSVAVRLGWTSLVSGSFLFFAPLAFIGFHPVAIFTMLAANLFYQIWIHTEIVGQLPRVVEFIFNTPSHHRVHHASNPEYLDRNYGGVLILYDRLFGTFAEERTEPVYGLTTPLCSHNPVKVALWEWWCMARDVVRARSAQEVLGYLFRPPGWSTNEPRGYTPLKIKNPFRRRLP